MFVVNDDMSIYVTRGDVVNLTITAEDRYGNPHQFSAGDVLRFTVVEKKACENVFLQKCFGVEAPTTSVEIFLSEADTKFGDVISKPTDYWYEVELNPFTNPETIIGYDVDGPRVFKLFPEGADIDVTPIEPSDIPIVDSELNVGSQRPVQNQAVARAILDIKAKMRKVIVDVPKEGWSASAPYTITLPVEGLDVDSDIIFNLEPAGEEATENEIISVGYITDINVGIDSVTIEASSLPLVSYSINLRSNVLNGETTAYEIAVKNGFEGTEEEWLESLRGLSIYRVNRELAGSATICDFSDFKVPVGFTPKVNDLVIFNDENLGCVYEVNNDNKTAVIAYLNVNLKGEKGDKGDTGQAGKDGISVTHSWEGTVLKVTSASGTASADLKGEKGDTGPKGDKGERGEAFTYSDFTAEQLKALTGPKGEKGDTGEQGPKGNTGEKGAKGDKGDTGATGPAGKDGTSVTHSWNGTVLSVTSASGTSSVDLKGAKGDKGDTGEKGADGKDAEGALRVTYDSSTMKASHTATEILAENEAGRLIYLVSGNEFAYLQFSNHVTATFRRITIYSAEDKSLTLEETFNIGQGGSVYKSEKIVKVENFVKTVNGIAPDEEGNVQIEVGGSGGGSVQADWNQNNANASDYVKNRTHWVEQSLGLLLEEQSVTANDYDNTAILDDQMQDCRITNGDKVVVTVNGIVYECTAWQGWDVNTTFAGDSRLLMEEGMQSLNPVDVPFLINHYYEAGDPFWGTEETVEWRITFTSPGNHTLKIEIPTGEVTYHTLDERFIPDTIARKSEVGGGGGVTSWNDLEDRPISEDVLLEETEANSYTHATLGKVWLVYNAIELEVGKTYTIVYNGASYDCVCQSAPSGFSDDPNAVAMGNFYVAGGANTGEPFAMLVSKELARIDIIDLTGASSVTVGIHAKGVYTLDKSLLPYGTPKIYNVYIYADWNEMEANILQWNYEEVLEKATDPYTIVRGIMNDEDGGHIILQCDGFNATGGTHHLAFSGLDNRFRNADMAKAVYLDFTTSTSEIVAMPVVNVQELIGGIENGTY